MISTTPTLAASKFPAAALPPLGAQSAPWGGPAARTLRGPDEDDDSPFEGDEDEDGDGDFEDDEEEEPPLQV